MYMTKRNALMDEAKAILDAGDTEKFAEKKDEIEALDEKWEEITKAQANYNALNGINDIMKRGLMMDMVNGTGNEILMGNEKNTEITASSEIYKTAWLKNLREEKLTDEEKNAYQIVNADPHTTGTNPDVIPTTLADKILRKAEELYPLWGDVRTMNVRGNYSVILDTEEGEAEWYAEETAGNAETIDTSNVLELKGNELAKYLDLTWKSRAMSLKDFEVYLVEKLGKKIGRALSRAVAHGTGPDASGGKGQPTGIVTKLKASAINQITEYTKDKLTWKEITTARGKIESGYSGNLTIYANGATIWNEIANVMDANKRPLFVPDTATSGAVGRMIGIVVKEDVSFDDGEILIGNVSDGYIANINEALSLKSEESVKGRKITYGAYMIVDGNVTFTKAFSLLKTADAAEETPGGGT